MKIGIRGMGLIGGSFEKAFLAAGHEVTNLKDATPSVVGACELIVICLPPLLVAPWVKEHAGEFGKGAVIVDAAGVKSVVCQALAETAKGRDWTYVGGHPMAGKERNGYANADANLYRGASMIFAVGACARTELLAAGEAAARLRDLVPPETGVAIGRLMALFGEIGFARFVVTDPQTHDAMIAYTSQLAHVVSSAYVRDELSQSHLGFSAGSFQDMTRVATVDPDIWTDLFLANRESLDAVLSRLVVRLSQYRDAIRASDADGLRALLAEGRAAKESSH